MKRAFERRVRNTDLYSLRSGMNVSQMFSHLQSDSKIYISIRPGIDASLMESGYGSLGWQRIERIQEEICRVAESECLGLCECQSHCSAIGPSATKIF